MVTQRRQTSLNTGIFQVIFFRGDSRSPGIIFNKGFSLSVPIDSDQGMERASGAQGGNTAGTGSRGEAIRTGPLGGITYGYGVSTSVCAQVASTYANYSQKAGYVYLIDSVHSHGFAIPTPRGNDPLAKQFPILTALYEVNLMKSVPNTKIIGIVWPASTDMPITSIPWPSEPSALKLAVNPEYEGGMVGAKGVVARFNNVITFRSTMRQAGRSGITLSRNSS